MEYLSVTPHTYVLIGRDMDPDLFRADVLGNYTSVCQVHSQDLEGGFSHTAIECVYT